MNYKARYTFLFLLLFIFSVSAFSQTTKVTGKIVDAATREPLPFVNIIFKNTTVGVTTDVEGLYSISTTLKVDSIIVSYIGYNRVTKAVKQGTTQELNIPMTQGVELTMVVVKAGENPAWRILRKIIANKEKNDRKSLDYYQYELYNKVEFDLNNINKATKQLLKPFSFVFNEIDSSNTKEKPYLPVFMTEALSDVYYRKSPQTKNEVVKASKVAGVQNASVSQFMGDMYQNVNIYDNSILVFGKTFISPIADNALLFYKFYLIDSMNIDGHKCYQLQFKPKRKGDLTFSGNLWAADTTFGIKRIEMSLAEDANINFINTTNVIQEYVYVDSTWMMKKERLVIDFNPFPINDKKKSMMGVYGRKTASYSNFVLNHPKDSKSYSLTENLKVADDAFNKSADYWKTHRLDSLNKDEKQIYHMIDTLQTIPTYKTWVDIVQMFVTGYKVVGNFEIGPYYNLYSFNAIEGNRFRFGGRTSNKFSKWYELSGYTAFGTLDEKFKYSLGIRAFVTKKPRVMVGMYYKNDNEILGESQNGFSQDNILSSLLAITPLNNLTNVKQTYAYYDREWFTGCNTSISIYNRKMSPLADFHYEYQQTPNSVINLQNITTTEVRLLTRFAYHEKYVEGVFTRVSMGTKWPIITAQYTLGIKNIFGGNYDYNKIVINWDHFIRTRGFGYFNYVMEYGKTFNPLPYPLLTLHGGNETYTYDPYAFNAMNYYEFVSSEYAYFKGEHHFDGFFFNKVPLLRKLKWREVLGGNVLVGKVNDESRTMLNFPNTLYDLSRGPYIEANAGIENIFKIFRFDGVWRLSYLDNPRVTPFSIRFSLNIVF